jgi:hypothetical protein
MLGLRIRKNERKFCFINEKKRVIIEDFLHNHETKQAIWERHGGTGPECGRLVKWMRQLGYQSISKNEKRICFSNEEKRVIIEDFLHNHETKQAIWEKYGGSGSEHGRLVRWMRQLGYLSDPLKKCTTFVFQKDPMKHLEQAKDIYSFHEYNKLQKRIKELEEQLLESELQVITFRTMVEIAEQEMNLSIKKKFNTKPLKK